MKKNLCGFLTVAALLATPRASLATPQIFFTDNFTNGSTTNGPSIPGGTKTASFTSYDIASTKNTLGGSYINNGTLRLSLNAATTSGFMEAQALFTTTPVTLNEIGDYIEMDIVFTNGTAAGSNLLVGTSSAIWIGLFDSGQTNPVPGDLANAGLSTTGGSDYAVGHCANWQGYCAQLINNGTSRLYTRPLQNGTGTSSANQELLGNNAGNGAFNNPAGTTLATLNPNPSFTFTPGGQYTLSFRLTLSAANNLTISNSLYSGNVAAGTPIFSQATNNITNATFLTAGFDGLGIGVLSKNSVASNVIMDISSITVSGSTLFIPCLTPFIVTEPAPVVVATNWSCAFSVSVNGGVFYQWHRNGTNLLNGGNISGATSDTLIIFPAGTNDVASGANGYYVTIWGYECPTNSTTNSLTLGTSSNLVWSGNGSVWDVATSANFLNGGNPAVFNYSDYVTFDDTPDSGSGITTVKLACSYLSAKSVTVNSTLNYIFTGSGSIAGPGALIYEGSGQLTMDCVNSYSGGTIISNSSAWLVLDQYGALGTGPVALAKAGGKMEVVPTGSASAGIKGDVTVADDFTIQFDGTGAYAGVFLGNLSGTAGQTLTLTPQNLANNSRYRVYGTNTVYNANLVLNGAATMPALVNGTVLAFYNSSGSQTYNGIISGNGGLVQRGYGTTILNGTNTYSGGTTPTTGTIGFGTNSVGDPVTSGPIGTGPLFLSPEAPNVTGSGTVMAWGGARTIANPVQYPSATDNLTLIVGGTNALTFTGPITLNGNNGAGNNTIRTFQVENTALTTFSGVVSGTGFGLTKTGKGVLALNNTETYTGPTTVSNGTLQVNGALDPSSTVTVCPNGVLAGTGAVNGAVAVDAGGTFAPGTSSIGTLTLNGGLILSGNLSFKVQKSLSLVQTNDIASVSGALTNIGNGFLVISNLGPALAVGDQFVLFNKPLTNGAVLGVTGGGVTWSNRLDIDGSVWVISLTPQVPAINSTIITNVSGAILPAQGTNLIFGGTNGIAGEPYFVFYQTNLATPLSNWIVLSSNTYMADGTFSVTNTITRTNRFYLLYAPY